MPQFVTDILYFNTTMTESTSHLSTQ